MSLPKQLFRFRPWSVLKRDRSGKPVERKCLDELEGGVFFCSSPRDFDDPQDNQLGGHATGSVFDMKRFMRFDFAGAPELMRKYKLGSITQLTEEVVTDPEDRKILKAAAGRQTRRNTRVLCFSSNCLNELMWAFYADNHKGVCFWFDTAHEFFRNAKPVLYTHSPTDVVHLEGSDSEADRLAFCKSLSWHFQKEWRIALPGIEPKKVSFPRESLRAIILGYRFPAPRFKELEAALVRGGYSVKDNFFRVERVPESYEFVLRKVSLLERRMICRSKPATKT